MAPKKNINNELLEGNEFRRLSKIFHSLTGKSATSFVFPGLKNRSGNGSSSAVVTANNDAKVVLTYRATENLAELGAEVLKRLHKEGASVPKLFARDKNWLVQEYREGPRLTQAITNEDPNGQKILMIKAINGLSDLQSKAKKNSPS